MHIGESLQESLDGGFVQRLLTLVNLEDFLVALHIIPVDGERNHQFDAVGLAEARQRSHLLGIERTEDDVALVGTFLQQGGTDIRIYRHVPGMNIGRDSLLLQLIASHQQSAVVLHHSLSVAIHIVQRQHHANLHGVAHHGRRSSTLGRRKSPRARSCGSSRSPGSIPRLLLVLLQILLIRNKQGGTLLQDVALLLHLRIRLHQFRQRQSVLVGNAKHRILLLHRINVTPFGGLGENTHTQSQSHNHQEISHTSSHNRSKFNVNIFRNHAFHGNNSTFHLQKYKKSRI